MHKVVGSQIYTRQLNSVRAGRLIQHASIRNLPQSSLNLSFLLNCTLAGFLLSARKTKAWRAGEGETDKGGRKARGGGGGQKRERHKERIQILPSSVTPEAKGRPALVVGTPFIQLYSNT